MPVSVFCFTNIDDFKHEEWPREMVCRPVVGDYVRSQGGQQLKVIQVTHLIAHDQLTDPAPLLKVELNHF